MSQSLVIIVNRSLDGLVLDSVYECFVKYDLLVFREVDGVTANERNSLASQYLMISKISDQIGVAEEYSDEEYVSQPLASIASDMVYFYTQFNSMHFARMCLEAVFCNRIFDADDLWLDNDYGAHLDGRKVRELLTSNPEWDWRKERRAIA